MVAVRKGDADNNGIAAFESFALSNESDTEFLINHFIRRPGA